MLKTINRANPARSRSAQDPYRAFSHNQDPKLTHQSMMGFVIINQKMASTEPNAGKPKANHHRNSW
jgi:hypothetical protein